MKTTIEIHDELLARAKRHARESGQTLRSVVEAGLRLALSSSAPDRRYRLADLRAGDSNAPDPLDQYSWSELRELIYVDPETRSGSR